MTNPTPHGQVPEALIDLIDAYAETRHRCGRIHNPKTEAARKAVIEALSGVQALSAAPAGWKLVPVEPTVDQEWAGKNAALRCSTMGEACKIYKAMLSTSPTPPAEQPDTTEAAWGGVYAELPAPNLPRGGFPDLFTELQMRDFADRTHALRMEQAAPKTAPVAQTAPAPGERCQHCIDRHDGIYGSWAAPCPYHDDDGKPRPTANAAPQQEAQEPCPTCAALARTVMLDQVSFDRKPDCYGIRQITDDEGVEEWEDIRTSPDVAREEANDMMATGRGEIYEVVPLWTTPQHAPQPAPGVGNSGFDHKTAADLLNNKTVSDEAVRKFVAASRWAHDERAALSATLLAMHGVLTSREAEIALLKKALLEAEAAPQPAPAPLSDDTKRLAWMADEWTPGHEKLYDKHVLETGGVGGLDDLRTFIDKQIAAQEGKT